MEAVLVRQSRVAPRTAIAKPLSAAVAIGTGGPFGAEGPIIVTGGAIGSLLGQVLHVSASERKIMLAAGAAAGMAATFGTPLAAVMLAIELLLFEFSTRALVPLVVATSVAGAIHAATFGAGPLFAVPPHHFAGITQLPWFAALGIVCGGLATLIARGLFAVERAYRRLPIAEFWHPIVGAIAWASLGLLVPRALGVGYDVIDDALAGRLAIATLLALAVGKLVIWWLALASGTSGGTLAPILIISSCTGGLIGQLVHDLVPSLSPTSFALVAMAATFGAATRAPFAAIVFVFELTRDDGPDVMANTRVGETMTTAVQTVAADASGDAARTALVSGRHSACPVVDADGRCVGMVTRSVLLAAADGRNEATVGELFGGDLVSVSADDSVLLALQGVLDESVDHLPVLDGDRLVGICTRTDVLRARQRALAADRPEPGWLARMRAGEG